MLLLSLIIIHLIADFLLQTDEMVSEKRKYIKKHSLHHLLLTAILLTVFWMTSFHYLDFVHAVLFPAIFISATHFVIDFMKVKLVDGYEKRDNGFILSFFILDQLMHLLMILLALQIFYGIEITALFRRFAELAMNGDAEMSVQNQVLFVVIILFLGTVVSGHMIRILLGTLPGQLMTFEGKYSFKNVLKESDFPLKGKGEKGLSEEYSYMIFNKHDLSRGKLIGYIERLLVILLTFYSSYPAIAFIVTAKSIARFKQMDDRDWAEYFLLGTLSSMFLGILFGILLREIIV